MKGQRKMKKIKKLFVLLLSIALAISAVPLSASAQSTTGFPDVPAGIWYEPYIEKIMWAQNMVGQMNIISGTYNEDGVLVFEPEREVKRGEFLKMMFEAAVSSGNQISLEYNENHSKAHWAGKYYTKAEADNILVADVYSSTQPMFPCTAEALDRPISRYEMAVILNNFCTNIAMQKTVVVTEPELHITDYTSIPTSYLLPVEQSYGKGLLSGHEDGSFCGSDTLTRAQACIVIYKYLFQDTIQGEGLQEWASYPKTETAEGKYLDPELSFANWLRNGHVDAWGKIDAEARIKLFGDANKTYFTSAADAAEYVTTVSVPVWTMDKAGNKIPSTCPITVNKAVAEEVKSIFQMIYDDPEQFPIYGGWSAGGARFTDTLRHSWGCAIDINAYYNCECNTKSGYLKVTCGYGWWPIGHADSSFAGSLTAPSPYSIGKNPGEYGYSVVKAFATYGWGWGGNGWSNGRSFDYMHFSVLPSGG